MKRLPSPVSTFQSPLRLLPTIVLWACMLVTCGIFIYFYFETISAPDSLEITSIGLIMNWLYIIFLLSLATACIFSFIRFFIRWKRNPRSILQSLLLTITLIGLFAGAYVSGNGNPLPVSGYEGNENTVFWLKLTDMWLYCLYILLALTLISLFGGIIWSYIKRTR